MKLIPDTIGRKFARQVLLVQKNSPSILFGAGVVGMIGSTVLACRATLQLEDIIQTTQRDLGTANSLDDPRYSENDRQKDKVIIYSRAVTGIARLYAPSVLLGAASIGCLTKSHNLLQERNLALTAAYAAVDEAFKSYRARVIEKYGEEEDRNLRYDAEVVDVIDEETGKVVSSLRVSPDQKGSLYARWFDEESSCWNREPEYNHLFLRGQQNYWNDVLKARGHVFLNEVYRDLGLSHTDKGALVGWIRHSDGDGFIDFGIFDDNQQALDFFNGRDEAILLDFNVDGIIWDKIDPNAGQVA